MNIKLIQNTDGGWHELHLYIKCATSDTEKVEKINKIRAAITDAISKIDTENHNDN